MCVGVACRGVSYSPSRKNPTKMVTWCDVPLKKQQKILKTDGMIKKNQKNDGMCQNVKSPQKILLQTSEKSPKMVCVSKKHEKGYKNIG